MNRRNFFKTIACGTCAYTFSRLSPTDQTNLTETKSRIIKGLPVAHADIHKELHEALYYNKLEHKDIQCILCPRKCLVGDQERGYCGVRENQGGNYYTLVYNRPCTARADPIEKKPFYHFHPQSLAFSLATAGCNMNCKYCQNWEISQARPEQVRSFPLPPQECVRQAKRLNCHSIAYTYTEPIIYWEYMHDIAKEAKKTGIKNTMISAGFIEEKPLRDLLPLLDAVKIDLKAFSDNFYREICRGRLDPILHTLKTIKAEEVWFEIVYLVLPTLNDSDNEIRALCNWIVNELGPDVPIHFSRFYPTYLMKNLPPTPVGTLERIHKIALSSGLRFVYIGNVPGHRNENTYCPSCQNRLIHRTGYNVTIEALNNGKCSRCNRTVPGVW